jgi:uncharacterized protein YgbK (DUF1537 family)
MRILALADDLTGALEVGAKFAEAGFDAKVAIGVDTQADCELTVIDTETRHLTGGEAARVIERVPAADAQIIYKKTDSTLRGNIADELRALARLRPDARIAYIPAYPKLGRTVVDGRLLVDRVPVHETAFARDPLNPIGDSRVERVIGRDLDCRVFDGACDEDVAGAVRTSIAGPGCCIIAGPASVAAALAAELREREATAPEWPLVQQCAIVNGSLHEASARQIAWAVETGCAWSILRIPASPGASHADHAAWMGRFVREYLKQTRIDALMIFGGDTASGILDALGIRVLAPVGEVVPGVPVSRVQGRQWHLISKAGGFGDEQVIGRVKEILDGTTGQSAFRNNDG